MQLENYNFRKQIAKVCDFVILLNFTNRLAIKQGLFENFRGRKSFKCSNKKMKKHLKPKDVVLIEKKNKILLLLLFI